MSLRHGPVLTGQGNASGGPHGSSPPSLTTLCCRGATSPRLELLQTLPPPHAPRPPILPHPVPTPNLAPAAGGSTALPTNSSATGSLLFSPPLLHLHLRPPPHTPHTPRAPVLSITYPCFPHPSNLLSWPQSRNPPVSAGPVPPNLRPQHPSSLQTLFQAPLFADARAAPEPAAGPTCQCP